MENKVIKNMEYWKKKNSIPGIEALEDSGLTDGRAGSSAFQMATPGSSPNKGFWKNLGKALNPLTGGPLGAIARQVAPNSKLVQGITNPFGIGGGPGLGVLGEQFGGGAGQAAAGMSMANAANVQHGNPMAAVPVQTPMVMKDPTEKIYIEGDYKEGDLINEDDFENQFRRTGEDPKDYPQLSVQDYSEIRVDEKGMYVQKLKEGEEIKGLETKQMFSKDSGVESPEESAPEGPMGPGGMGIKGGVGEAKSVM
tara:strand:- start:110 stop:868 length:759 start_codon:yes stop_codon:yes gene_type:complete